MQYEDSSTESDSSDEDELEVILLDCMFPLKPKCEVPRLNLEDISAFQCEEMFR